MPRQAEPAREFIAQIGLIPEIAPKEQYDPSQDRQCPHRMADGANRDAAAPGRPEDDPNSAQPAEERHQGDRPGDNRQGDQQDDISEKKQDRQEEHGAEKFRTLPRTGFTGERRKILGQSDE